MFHIKSHPSDPGDLPGPGGITQTRSVVLVEDDVDNRESITEALETAGFRVHSLATAQEALKILDAPRCPGLILLDLRMPRMGGGELLAAIALRPDRERFRVVLVSADTEAPALATRPRVVEVLRKPFALEKLLDAVRRYA
jgi:two-component system C4-dicarboxylate transport response regulator DctD